MLDLPSCASYELFLNHPEWMAIEADGLAKTPQGWNDIRMFQPWEDEGKRTLNPALLELHKEYVDMCIDAGVDGASHVLNEGAVDSVINGGDLIFGRNGDCRFQGVSSVPCVDSRSMTVQSSIMVCCCGSLPARMPNSSRAAVCPISKRGGATVESWGRHTDVISRLSKPISRRAFPTLIPLALQ